MPAPFPHYNEPPLIETVLAVQFAPLRGLSTAHIGLFWDRLGSAWTRVEEVEARGQIVQVVPRSDGWLGDAVFFPGRMNRLRILQEPGDRMLQIENGWFAYNWRRPRQDAPYPRFATLLPEFLDLFSKWQGFLSEQQIGAVAPNLWEVSYVNAIEKGSVWNSSEDWAKVLPELLKVPKLGPLGAPMTGQLRWRFPLLSDSGFLEISLNHIVNAGHDREALQIVQLARGVLSSLDQVQAGLETGHDAIVRAFEVMASDEAQQHWGKA